MYLDKNGIEQHRSYLDSGILVARPKSPTTAVASAPDWSRWISTFCVQSDTSKRVAHESCFFRAIFFFPQYKTNNRRSDLTRNELKAVRRPTFGCEPIELRRLNERIRRFWNGL